MRVLTLSPLMPFIPLTSSRGQASTLSFRPSTSQQEVSWPGWAAHIPVGGWR